MRLDELKSALKADFPDRAQEFFTFDALFRELLAARAIDFRDRGVNIEEPVCADIKKDFLRAISGEALGYITGRVPFYREEYFVGEGVLIPRSDTEILVDKAISLLPQNAYFADFCTGSGCIAVSVLASRPDACAFACDISDTALSYAKKNRDANGVFARLTLQKLDITQDNELPLFDAILSNPPYITADEMRLLPENVRREPETALFGGEDGLLFYRTIVSFYAKNLKKNGFFLFEIGAYQKKAVSEILAEAGFSAQVFSDFSGMDRVIFAKKYE